MITAYVLAGMWVSFLAGVATHEVINELREPTANVQIEEVEDPELLYCSETTAFVDITSRQFRGFSNQNKGH